MMTTAVAKALLAAASGDEGAMIEVAKSGTMSKAELYELMVQLGQKRRRDGESAQQAFTRFATFDPVGRQLLAAHMDKRLRGQPSYERPPDSIAKNSTEGLVEPDLEKLVQEHMAKNPKARRNQAFDAVLSTPEGTRAYQADKARRMRAAGAARAPSFGGE